MAIKGVKDLPDRTPTTRVNIYLRDTGLSDRELELVASMLRGIAFGVSGAQTISMRTNDLFRRNRCVMVEFRSPRKCQEFLDACKRLIAPAVQEKIKINQRARFH